MTAPSLYRMLVDLEHSPHLTYDDLLSQIQKADSVEILDLVMDSARDLPQGDVVKLRQAYEDRREVLMGA